VIALEYLDEGDERGEGQGLLLKSTWLRARYGYHDKVEGKEMKHGPQQLCRARPKHTRTRGTRLLAWIGDQVRLRLLESSPRVLYTGGGTASY